MVRSIDEMLLRNMDIYQLKIILMDVRPLIWRRIQVQDTVNLPQLHKVLQIVMGWENSHLHRFTVDRRRHLGKFDAIDDQHHHASKVPLRLLLGEQDTKFLYYEYDFGDGWIHEVCNEKTLPPEPGKLYPICISGERNCPPEDCGGPNGYQEMLRALRGERDPDHASTIEWIGRDFDPKAFDADAVNRRLRRLKIRS
jgi:Plasmid pRiA4b ORF-3-like protein